MNTTQQKGKKKKFSNNQIVVFKFGDRNLVGKICNIKPVGKKAFIYDVVGEDGKIFEDLLVDALMKHSIDSKLTRAFYKAHGISEDHMPASEFDSPEMDTESVIGPVPVEKEEIITPERDIASLFSDEEKDNWN